MVDYAQTGITNVPSLICDLDLGVAPRLLFSAGAVLGSASLSVTAQSAGVGIFRIASFTAAIGNPGTATWVGATTMRFNVTTANTNVTWARLAICVSAVLSATTAITVTTGLGISFGTTGVKTASVEITSAFTPLASTASSSVEITLHGSSGAAMVGLFIFVPDQQVTLPFTATAAPAPSTIFTLAQTGAGQG